MPAAFWWGLLALPLGALGIAVLVGVFWLVTAFIDDRLTIVGPSDRQRKNGRTYSYHVDHGASIYAARRAYLWRLFGLRLYVVAGRVDREAAKRAKTALYGADR